MYKSTFILFYSNLLSAFFHFSSLEVKLCNSQLGKYSLIFTKLDKWYLHREEILEQINYFIRICNGLMLTKWKNSLHFRNVLLHYKIQTIYVIPSHNHIITLQNVFVLLTYLMISVQKKKYTRLMHQENN